jgi:hypothetical protein
LAYTVDDAVLDALNSGLIYEIFAQYGLSHRAPER